MSILFLLNQDFTVRPGGIESNPVMKISVNGLVLVFFHSPRCAICTRKVPLFKSFQRYIGGCRLALVNATDSGIVYKSQNTTTPIQYVPFIVLYNNGVPYAEYKGPMDLENIQNFIHSLSKEIQNSFITPHKKIVSRGGPLYGEEEVTYLTT